MSSKFSKIIDSPISFGSTITSLTVGMGRCGLFSVPIAARSHFCVATLTSLRVLFQRWKTFFVGKHSFSIVRVETFR